MRGREDAVLGKVVSGEVAVEQRPKKVFLPSS